GSAELRSFLSGRGTRSLGTGGGMALNVALVGYGAIAYVHARALQRLQATPEWRALQLCGVMGRRAEPAAEFARQYGIPRATTDLAELLATPGLDAVIVTSPSERHAEQTAQALQ